MKRLAVLALTAAVSFAAEFTTGQAARAVIGQDTFTRQSPDSKTDLVVGGVSGLAYANGFLVVADANRVGASPINNRVLIYKNLPNWVQDPAAEVPQVEFGRCQLCKVKADVVVGQKDFTTSDVGLSQNGLRLPTAVATDGTMLVVADTDNNRVLIWRTLPSANYAPADLVLGQKDFTGNAPNAGTGDARVPSASSLRGPQGVWLQSGKLFVADDLNNRVLIWNSIPRESNQPADVVLGQPNFTTGAAPVLTAPTPTANNLLNPVSVTSDGTRLYVSDLGHNRVLIWNSIPESNGVPANVVVGQREMSGETNAGANNTTALCTPTKDSAGNDVYPVRCAATLDFPRFALSDGQRLFIADGGNDRVLVYKQIPTQNGMAADIILGQFDDKTDQNSDNANPEARSSADSVRAPMSLAWDGVNLYVSDPFDRRVLLFTAGDDGLPITGVRNAAALEVYATGRVAFGGTLAENDEITISIGEKEYTYKAAKDETFAHAVVSLTNKINEGQGDPNAIATPNVVIGAVLLTARKPGEEGNLIPFSVAVTDGSGINAVPNGITLQNGQSAARIPPGTLIALRGERLSETTAQAALDANPLPTELGGVQVYVDGVRIPLLYVSPTQINAQLPYEVNDANSVSAYVRVKTANGDVRVTRAIGVPVVPNNPGIFTFGGQDPRPGIVLHGSSNATGTISIDGTALAGDTATITIEDREYKYTVQSGDTLAKIRDNLINLVNQDPKVEAYPAGVFTRVRLRARQPGQAGNGIQYKAVGAGQVILTATTANLCCANTAYSLVTPENPALAGETIIVYATGLGMVQPDPAKFALTTGYKFDGPTPNEPDQFVYSTAGARTANVLYAGLKPGDPAGLYQVELELSTDLRTDPQTQLYIAQDIFISNLVTFPLFNPNPPAPAEE